MAEDTSPLLQVDGLSLSFATTAGARVRVLEDVSLAVRKGEAVGLVGESGCGKSMTAKSIMRLLPSPPSFVDAGQILLEGEDLLALPRHAMRRVRGRRIGMIFQEPMTSLNPVFSIGFQVTEVLRIQQGLSARAAMEHAAELLERVGIGAARRRLAQYPHELSGGLRQRVMIAIAVACNPELLIADEPTTALDVTTQLQILELIDKLRRELGMGVLMITHDMGVVAQFCDRVAVMYAGRIIEQAPTHELFTHPRHPYTAGLLASMPQLGQHQARLHTIAGAVPPPGQRGPGCYFADRCPYATDECRRLIPDLKPMPDAPRHAFACFHPMP